jgi:glucokinase
MNHKFLGVEIGGTKIQIFLTDEHANVLDRHKFFVGDRKDATYIRDNIGKMLSKILQNDKISAIGVGYGGPVDHQTGEVITSHQVEGWAGFSLRQWLQQRTALPVVVENDANAAAYGEALCGAGRGFSRVFYITLGSGVGGGYVIDKEIYHGRKPGEAEIGHVRLDRKGTILESKCAGWAVDRKIRRYIKENPGSILAGIVGDNAHGEARFLLEAIKGGDKGADKILQETAGDLAFGLSHAVHILNPEIIILGGGLSLLGDQLISAVKKDLPQYVMRAFDTPELCIAELKEDAVCIGASLLAIKHFNNS